MASSAPLRYGPVVGDEEEGEALCVLLVKVE